MVTVVQCPCGSSTAAVQKAEGFFCHDAHLSLLFPCLSRRDEWGGVGVACRVIDDNAIKLYQGPIVHGLAFAVYLLLKGTVTPNKLINIFHLA